MRYRDIMTEIEHIDSSGYGEYDVSDDLRQMNNRSYRLVQSFSLIIAGEHITVKTAPDGRLQDYLLSIPGESIGYFSASHVTIETPDGQQRDALVVNNIGLVTRYRGKGIAEALYRTILDQGTVLASGSQQTQSSSIIWKKMMNDPALHRYVNDEHTGKTVPWDDQDMSGPVRYMISREAI